MDSSLCTLGHVQEREFWQLLEEVLGRSYGRALAHDQVLDRLGGMTAVEFTGKHYDMGNKLRVVEAQVELALQHPEIGEAFRAYLKEFCKTL